MALNLITDSETKVLFISPHPDDVELGAGATLAKCVRLGAEVYYIALTNIEGNKLWAKTQLDFLLDEKNNLLPFGKLE